MPTTEAGKTYLAEFSGIVEYWRVRGRSDDSVAQYYIDAWLSARHNAEHAIDAIEAEARDMTGIEAVNLRVDRIVAAERARIRAAVEAMPAQPYSLSGLDTTIDSRMVNRAAVLRIIDEEDA